MMRTKLLFTTIALLFFMVWVIPVSAHIIAIEGQARYRIPRNAPEEQDYSFETPFLVTRYIQDQNGEALYIGPQESQAVFAYLTRKDFDVYKIRVKEEEVPVLISASALPPACLQTRGNYPYTALLSPQTSPSESSPPDMDLPFEVPEGYSITIAANPELDYDEQRAVFDLDSADPELGLGISWFLPLGLTQDCLLFAPYTCTFDNTIAQRVKTPGDYYIVIWDPKGRQQDYTANIGMKEDTSGVIQQTDMQEAVEDNALLHLPCNEPYPIKSIFQFSR